MFLQGPIIPTVSALPSAASNEGRMLRQGGKLWVSNGTTWVDLEAGGGSGLTYLQTLSVGMLLT